MKKSVMFSKVYFVLSEMIDAYVEAGQPTPESQYFSGYTSAECEEFKRCFLEMRDHCREYGQQLLKPPKPRKLHL